jgi:hypothetical protein
MCGVLPNGTSTTTKVSSARSPGGAGWIANVKQEKARFEKEVKEVLALRYTSVSLPYHIGNGWFGGFLPAISFSIVAAEGNIYSGMWYPIIIAPVTFVIGILFIPETKDVDIYEHD